jgi:hypothetical protein
MEAVCSSETSVNRREYSSKSVLHYVKIKKKNRASLYGEMGFGL